jgi:hypothetical protein
MHNTEIAHLEELLEAHKSRLHEREMQAARYGAAADPIISIEIKEIKAEIARIAKEINHAKGIPESDKANESLSLDTPTSQDYGKTSSSSASRFPSPQMRRVLGVSFAVVLIAIATYLIMLSGIAKPNQGIAQAPTEIAQTKVNPVSQASDVASIKQITDTINIEQILVSQSETQYQLQVTLKNKIQQDILVKRISILVEEPLEQEWCNIVSGEIMGTITVSDTVIVKSITDDNIQFGGSVNAEEAPGYSRSLVGNVTVDPSNCTPEGKKNPRLREAHLELQFDASSVLSANKYGYIYINIPLSIEAVTDNPLVDNPQFKLTRFLESKVLGGHKRISIKVWTDLYSEPIIGQFTGEVPKQ